MRFAFEPNFLACIVVASDNGLYFRRVEATRCDEYVSILTLRITLSTCEYLELNPHGNRLFMGQCGVITRLKLRVCRTNGHVFESIGMAFVSEQVCLDKRNQCLTFKLSTYQSA